VAEALSLSTCTSTPGAGQPYIRFLRFDSVALSTNRQSQPRRGTPPSQRGTDRSFAAPSNQRRRGKWTRRPMRSNGLWENTCRWTDRWGYKGSPGGTR